MAKYDATGRSSARKWLKIEEQFVARRISMLESPAFRVLTGAAHRVLSRIELEHMQHAGLENGKLPCLYDDFAAYGMDRHSVAPAIRELEALGFLKVKRGNGGNSEFKAPNIFTLTYLPIQLPTGDAREPTDDWKRITTAEQAKKAQAEARADKAIRPPRKNRKPMGETPTRLVGETPTSSREKPPRHSREKPPRLSISPRGGEEPLGSARAGEGPQGSQSPSARGTAAPSLQSISSLVAEAAKKMRAQ